MNPPNEQPSDALPFTEICRILRLNEFSSAAKCPTEWDNWLHTTFSVRPDSFPAINRKEKFLVYLCDKIILAQNGFSDPDTTIEWVRVEHLREAYVSLRLHLGGNPSKLSFEWSEAYKSAQQLIWLRIDEIDRWQPGIVPGTAQGEICQPVPGVINSIEKDLITPPPNTTNTLVAQVEKQNAAMPLRSENTVPNEPAPHAGSPLPTVATPVPDEVDWLKEYTAYTLRELESKIGISKSVLQEKFQQESYNGKPIYRKAIGQAYWLNVWVAAQPLRMPESK